MGKFDSSRTRVAPVFDRLLESDKTGESWVSDLLALGSRSAEIAAVSSKQRLVRGHGPRWGKHEVSLPAPGSLLEYLVQNINPAQVAASGDVGQVLRRRTALAEHDEATVTEAIANLKAGKRGKQWFVLEGDSRPDALLETEDVVVCIEGKRTEGSCTSKTKWMGSRSQLLRHMDAATEKYEGKRVLGLLIVEGDGGADAVAPNGFWLNESASQHEAHMLASSLPHRTPEDRHRIASGILGVTTWQAVCESRGLPWPPASDDE